MENLSVFDRDLVVAQKIFGYITDMSSLFNNNEDSNSSGVLFYIVGTSADMLKLIPFGVPFINYVRSVGGLIQESELTFESPRIWGTQAHHRNRVRCNDTDAFDHEEYFCKISNATANNSVPIQILEDKNLFRIVECESNIEIMRMARLLTQTIVIPRIYWMFMLKAVKDGQEEEWPVFCSRGALFAGEVMEFMKGWVPMEDVTHRVILCSDYSVEKDGLTINYEHMEYSFTFGKNVINPADIRISNDMSKVLDLVEESHMKFLGVI